MGYCISSVSISNSGCSTTNKTLSWSACGTPSGGYTCAEIQIVKIYRNGSYVGEIDNWYSGSGCIRSFLVNATEGTTYTWKFDCYAYWGSLLESTSVSLTTPYALKPFNLTADWDAENLSTDVDLTWDFTDCESSINSFTIQKYNYGTSTWEDYQTGVTKSLRTYTTTGNALWTTVTYRVAANTDGGGYPSDSVSVNLSYLKPAIVYAECVTSDYPTLTFTAETTNFDANATSVNWYLDGVLDGTSTGSTYSSVLPDTTDFHLISAKYVRNSFTGESANDISIKFSVSVYSGFTSNGNMVIPSGYTYCDYLIVAGGGAGGYAYTNQTPAPSALRGGGGGAGGMLEGRIINPSAGTYTVIVGNGGSGTGYTNGGNSSFYGLTAIGGGAGGYAFFQTGYSGKTGGSGGGGGKVILYGKGGAGTTGQGYSGATAESRSGGGAGGGGGKSAIGTVPTGGAGKASIITGGTYTFSKGGNAAIGNGNVTGTAGVNYGDGGNGGSSDGNNKTAYYGGNGKQGYVYIILTIPFPVVINSPTGLTENNTTCTGTTIHWHNNNVSGVTGNYIQVSGLTGYTTIGTVSSGTTSFNITGLTPNTTYKFRVTAYNDGYSAYSIAHSITTLDPTPFNVTGSTTGYVLNHVVTWDINNPAYGTSIIPLISGATTTGWTSGTTLSKNAVTYTFTGLSYYIYYEVKIVRIGTEYPSDSYYFMLDDTPPVYAEVSGTSVLCNGGSTGTLTFYNESGGTGNYQYSIDSGNTWYSGSSFTGLTAGSYDCIIKENENPSNTYYVDDLTITEPTVLYAGIIAANQSVCSGATPALLTSIHDASGASGSYIYQWQYSVNGIGYFNIAGGTSTTYQPPSLTQTTYYKRRVYDTACGIVYADYSNVITITIYPALYTGTIGSNQSIPIDTAPAQLTTIVSPTGQSGAYVYQWQISTDNVTWTDIPSAINANYQPTVLLTDTYFRKIVYGDCESGYTNSVLINVYGMLKPPFCGGTYYAISATTCGNSDGKITITDVDYFNFYDISLTDTDSNSYTFNILTGEATGLTSGYYFLTATVKPEYWGVYGRDNCQFDWIKIEDADNPAFLVSVSVRPLQCQPFDRQFGRIFYNVSGLTSGHTYSFYAFTSDLSLYYSATGITSTEGFILANANAECYWVIIRDETTGCALLLDNRCVPSLNLFSQGGIKKLYIAKWSDDVDYNYWSTADDDYFLEFEDTSFFTSTKIKEFLSLTGGTTGITWYELPIAPKAVQLNQKLEKVRQGFIFTDTLTFAVSKGNATKWTAMATLLNPENKWMFVVQDADGFWWCGGYRHGARITAYNFKTGLRSEDDGYSLEVKAVSENKILTSLDEDYVINYIQ